MRDIKWNEKIWWEPKRVGIDNIGIKNASILELASYDGKDFILMELKGKPWKYTVPALRKKNDDILDQGNKKITTGLHKQSQDSHNSRSKCMLFY